MRGLLTLAAVALSGAAAPTLAQSYADQRRWDAAQARYARETQIFQEERARYDAVAHDYRGAYPDGYAAPASPPPPPGAYRDGYGAPPPPPPGDDRAPGAYDRYENEYDAPR